MRVSVLPGDGQLDGGRNTRVSERLFLWRAARDVAVVLLMTAGLVAALSCAERSTDERAASSVPSPERTTDATASVSATVLQSPMSETAPAATPTPDGLEGSAVATGDSLIDAIVVAATSGAVGNLAGMMEFETLSCSDVSREGFIGPSCPDDVGEGTEIEAVFRGACSGDLLNTEELGPSLEHDFANAEFEVLAVFRAPPDYTFFSEPTQRVVVFRNQIVDAFPGEIAFLLGNEGIVAWQAMCDDTLLPSAPDVDYIIPPPV